MLLGIESTFTNYGHRINYGVRTDGARVDFEMSGRQSDRVAQAIGTKWDTPADAAKALGKSANYFARGDLSLGLEAAEWLESQTGFRAGWLLWGELPERIDQKRISARRVGYEEGLSAAARMLQAEVIRLRAECPDYALLLRIPRIRITTPGGTSSLASSTPY